MPDDVTRKLAISIGVVLGLVPLMATLTEGTFDPAFRTVRDAQALFYDAQARSLLDLRLDVPLSAIGGEGITIDGETYGYFGFTPALFRMPLMVFYPDSYPNLAVWSYLAAFLLQAAATIGIWRVVQRRFDLHPHPAVDGILVFSVLAASPNVLLTARSNMYEEVILWGATMTVVTFWAVLRVLETPSWRWMITASIGAILAMLARPPTGGAALLAVGVAAVALFLRDRSIWRRCVALMAGAAVGGLLFVGINQAKFGTFVNPPYQYHYLYSRQPDRLAALQEHGTNQIVNIPTNVVQYLRPDTVHFTSDFPWLVFRMPDHAPVLIIGDPYFDGFEEPTSVTAVAPVLFVLALIGTATAVRRRIVDFLNPIGAGLLAVLATSSFFFNAMRYLGDFIPWLVVGACVGLGAMMQWQMSVRTKRCLVALAFVGLAWSLYATLTLARYYQSRVIDIVLGSI